MKTMLWQIETHEAEELNNRLNREEEISLFINETPSTAGGGAEVFEPTPPLLLNLLAVSITSFRSGAHVSLPVEGVALVLGV